MSNPIGVALVGCGNIATAYVEQMKSYPEVVIRGFFDLDATRSQAFAAEHGATAYSSLDVLLADASVEVVVNLSIHHAHFEVNAAALQAGKHVYTEKPLALTYAEAQALVKLADTQGLRLGSAPITYLGEAQQTVSQHLANERLGPLRLVYAELNHGRIETWHPNPPPFYDVGVVWDVGIYPLTIITAFLGPAVEVRAFGNVMMPNRTTLEGEPFTITTPDVVTALITLKKETLVRLSCNFYTTSSKQGASMEFHGDDGSLYLGNCFHFDADVAHAESESDFTSLPLLREPFEGVEFGRGLQDFAQAILENRPHRAAAAHAAHVIEIMEAIDTSIASGNPIKIGSTFPTPTPMPWTK